MIITSRIPRARILPLIAAVVAAAATPTIAAAQQTQAAPSPAEKPTSPKKTSPEETSPAAMPQSTPQEAVAKGHAMLAAGQAAEFMRAFMLPEDIETLEKDGQFERIVDSFKSRKAKELEDVLKRAMAVEPEMIEATETQRAMAVFTVEDPKSAGTPRSRDTSVTFEKVDDVWRMSNRRRPPR